LRGDQCKPLDVVAYLFLLFWDLRIPSHGFPVLLQLDFQVDAPVLDLEVGLLGIAI